MAGQSPPTLPPSALTRARALIGRGDRVLLGLAGPPGCGKSFLAQALNEALPALSRVVPMDGFHLAQCELARLGRAGRKGAPDTFDALGYLALLHRLRAPAADETIHAPAFRREIEEPIAGAIAVPADIRLVITEGNYLLLDEPPWHQVAGLLDETWYIDVDPELRRRRLTRRHEQHGRSPQAARDWVESTDEPNARRIEAARGRADWVFRWEAV